MINLYLKTLTLVLVFLIQFKCFSIEYVDSLKLINENSNILAAKKEMQASFENFYLSKNELRGFNPLATVSFNVLEDIFVARINFTENLYDAGLRKYNALLALNSKKHYEIMGLEVEQNLYVQSISIFLELDKYRRLKSLYRIFLNKLDLLLKYKNNARRAHLISREEILEVEVFYDKINFEFDIIELKIDSLTRNLRFLLKEKDLNEDKIGSPEEYISSSYIKLKEVLFKKDFENIKLRQLKLKELRVIEDGKRLSYLIEKTNYMPKVNISLGFNAYKDRIGRISSEVKYDVFALITLDIPLLSSSEKKFLQKSYIYSSKSIKSKLKYEGERTVQSIRERMEKIDSYQREIDHSSRSIIQLEQLLKESERFVMSGQQTAANFLRFIQKKIDNESQYINASINLLAKKAELISSPTLNIDDEVSDNELLLNDRVNNDIQGTFYDKTIPVN